MRPLALCVAMLLLGARAFAQVLPADAGPSAELSDLSRRVADLQSILEREFGLKEVLVGGGSAREILDSLYFGKPLRPRDIDLFVVADDKVTRKRAFQIARRLRSAAAEELTLTDIEPRPRGNPTLPPSIAYNAGYGFFLKGTDGTTFDFSLFHSRGDLALNGALNIDTIMLRLRKGQTITGLVNQMRGKSYREVVAQGTVLDIYRGYEAWQQNRLAVAHPAEVASKPVLWTIRLARSFGRAGYQSLPPDVVDLLREADASGSPPFRLQLASRYLERLLADPQARVELEMVKKAGVLQRHDDVRPLLRGPRAWRVDPLRQRLEASARPAGRSARTQGARR